MKNFFINARKYGLSQHLNYFFNYNKCVVHLQGDLSWVPKNSIMEPYAITEMDFDNDDDLLIWSKLIKSSYNEGNENVEYAKKTLKNHLYLNAIKVFFLKHNDMIIGTFTIGNFKDNSKIASGARLAILPEYQGKGLAKQLLVYSYNYLLDLGYKYFEGTFSIIRVESLILHFKMGFIPQYNRKYVQYKDINRFWFNKLLAKYQLWNYYRAYKKKFSGNFRS